MRVCLAGERQLSGAGRQLSVRQHQLNAGERQLKDPQRQLSVLKLVNASYPVRDAS